MIFAERKYLNNFKTQLQEGINYYKNLIGEWPDVASNQLMLYAEDLIISEGKLNNILI